jgi:cytoskeleton protein RodZ
MAAADPFLSRTEGGRPLSEERTLTVGQYLREEREKKNLSLEEVAKVTRITLENLQALERDDFQAISAPIFVRGFLRNYASQLGLDPNEIMARYESQVDLLKISPKVKESPPIKNGSPLFKYIAFLILILIGTAIGFYYYQQAPPPPPPPSATPPPPPAVAVQPPPPTAPPPPEGPAPQVASQPEKEKKQPEKAPATAPKGTLEKSEERGHILKVIAKEKTWLRIKPDDQPVIDVLLQPGETVSWSTRGKFNITVGNAGGIEIFFDGVSQGIPGKSGQVIHLVLPKETNPSKAEPQKETKPSTESVPKKIEPSKEIAAKEPMADGREK